MDGGAVAGAPHGPAGPAGPGRRAGAAGDPDGMDRRVEPGSLSQKALGPFPPFITARAAFPSSTDAPVPDLFRRGARRAGPPNTVQ